VPGKGTTRGAAGNGLGPTIIYLLVAAGVGLGNTIKYLRGAAGIGLGTTAKYLQRSTSGAACIGLGTPIKLRRQQLGQGLHTQKLGTNQMNPPVV
jgi:hypothetical protein